MNKCKVIMKICGWFGLFCIAFLNTTAAYASKISSLYQATLPVATQSAEERTDAIQKGLRQVLIKVTGTKQVLNNIRIKNSLAKAERFVQEFGYTQMSQQPGYRLDLQFDSENINQLLQNASAPIWDAHRPLVL